MYIEFDFMHHLLTITMYNYIIIWKVNSVKIRSNYNVLAVIQFFEGYSNILKGQLHPSSIFTSPFKCFNGELLPRMFQKVGSKFTITLLNNSV